MLLTGSNDVGRRNQASLVENQQHIDSYHHLHLILRYLFLPPLPPPLNPSSFPPPLFSILSRQNPISQIIYCLLPHVLHIAHFS